MSEKLKNSSEIYNEIMDKLCDDESIGMRIYDMALRENAIKYIKKYIDSLENIRLENGVWEVGPFPKRRDYVATGAANALFDFFDLTVEDLK